MDRTYLLLQLSDPLFPIGGYAHSYGLETYTQKGLVHDEATAAAYLEQKLRLSFLHSDLLPVRLAWEYSHDGDVGGLTELDTIVSASRLPAEIRSAGWKLGSRFLKTIQSFLQPFPSTLAKYWEAAGNHANYPVCFGAACAALGITKDDTLSHFLYSQVTAMVTCCVKSIPLSQTSGQKLLYQLHPLLEELVQQCLTLPREQVCLSTTSFDIRCMEHERLYSRLYMS